MNKQRRRGFSVKPEGRILIEQKMRDKGYNRDKLAEVAEISIDTINSLLRGDNKERKTIEAVARALDIQLTDIVDASELYPQVENITKDDININWVQVCHKMLEEQQEQQRIRRKASAMGYEVNVHVPLGLVERKQQQRRNENVERKEIYQLEPEVITKTYQHQDFLQEVINKGYQGKNKHTAIVGEPGAGKTTLLNAIASDIKDKNQKLPIFISLGSLQGMTLADYILKKWLPDAIRLINIVPTSEIEAQLQTEFYQGNFYLLLDGVDEMGESSPIQALNKISQELTNWLGQARVILTCRLNVWDATVTNNILPGFNTFKTQEFNPEQVNTFIAEWFQVANNINGGEKLIAQLQEEGKERIRELVTNPLRLCLLCQIFDQNDQGELPETKAQFYEIFTRYFYEWKPELVPDLIKSYELKQELHEALGKLALAGINSDLRFRLKRSFAVKTMGDEKLFNLACEVGWLNQVDRDAVNDEDVYAFFHPNFQEYFAALVIDDWRYFLNHVSDNPDEGIYRVF
ncbi:MAG: NACHT domain-containing protein, partial [Cuspidothrix sp.]